MTPISYDCGNKLHYPRLNHIHVHFKIFVASWGNIVLLLIGFISYDTEYLIYFPGKWTKNSQLTVFLYFPG